MSIDTSECKSSSSQMIRGIEIGTFGVWMNEQKFHYIWMSIVATPHKHFVVIINFQIPIDSLAIWMFK